ncbi:hypothetical protein ACS0TY_010466 [Phlomoides rotata]
METDVFCREPLHVQTSGQRPSFTASPTTPAISSLYKLSNKPSLPATTTSPGWSLMKVYEIWNKDNFILACVEFPCIS